MSPAVRAVPAGKYTPFELVKVKPFRLVSVYLVGPLIVPEGVVVAGEIEFHTVGEVAAREDVLFPSRFRTRLLETSTAAAGGGVSRNVSADPSSEMSAARVAPLRHMLFNRKYDFAPI
jgi:hypothetical protein